MRESPALRIAEILQADGAEIVGYDPEATTDLIPMVDDPIEAARDADVLLVATEWPEFGAVDLMKVAMVMKGYRIVDARNLLDPKSVRAAGLDYWGLGRPRA